MSDGPLRIAALVFAGSDLLDIAGTLAVFSSATLHARPNSPYPLYQVEAISIDGGPVRTEQGIVIDSSKAPDELVGVDSLVVVGGSPSKVMDPRLVEWVRRNHANARRVASVCGGAFILAEAGLLNGLEATTHWDFCRKMRRDYPATIVREDAIYIPGDHVWTSAGVTSGIDMALAMVEEDYGREVALAVARFQVVFLKRPGGQSQFSAPLRSQAVDGPLATLLAWIIENPEADLSTEVLAERANMSLRNFHRAFKGAAGVSPAQWVEGARVEHAKRLLEQTEQQVEQIALRSGFGSYERMRRAFVRRLTVSPTDYRARFSPRPRVRARDPIQVPPNPQTRLDGVTTH